MPDLLFELFSEEIPARMQAKAADDLRRMVTEKLVSEGLVYEGAKAFATPRRLTLTVHGIPARQSDLKEERKGPRVGGPSTAIQGFLKAAGLTSLDEAKIQSDPKKGDIYVALIEKPGRPTLEVLAEILPTIVVSFPWLKSMRWGSKEQNRQESLLVTQSGDSITTESGDRVVVDTWLRWVRPLHSIIATFGIETEEPDVVPFTVGGIEAGRTTFGHRFMAPAAIQVRRFEDYETKLKAAKVVLDSQTRKDIILADAKELAFAQGFELFEDIGVLDEVAGLVEWPVVLMGEFDEEFLSLPGEVIRSTIRNNQKCFVVRNSQTGKLVNRFILTANIEASDGGKAIIGGNERVIRARLSDAKFFYEADRKIRLEDRLPKFDNIVFHEKLGTQRERIARIEALAGQIAPLVGADVDLARRAAMLCKTDLLTEVVGEFPELQGIMGREFALKQGEDGSVAFAIEQHYSPKGPDDLPPMDPVSVAVALADKIDTLVGFWAIDEKPTGSKDPYALRRAALGVIRIILENNIRFPFDLVPEYVIEKDDVPETSYKWQSINLDYYNEFEVGYALDEVEQGGFSENRGGLIADALKHLGKSIKDRNYLSDRMRRPTPYRVRTQRSLFPATVTHASLLAFFAERLKGQLREQGARHDLVDAVFALEGQDDLLMIVRRIEALGKFLDTDDGKNLLAGTKRAANILRIEEKKDGKTYDSAPDFALYSLDEEKALASAIRRTKIATSLALKGEDFENAMGHMAELRPAVDAFFEHVKVNDDDPKVRENRLKLLNEIRAATRAVADFSRIQD